MGLSFWQDLFRFRTFNVTNDCDIIRSNQVQNPDWLMVTKKSIQKKMQDLANPAVQFDFSAYNYRKSEGTFLFGSVTLSEDLANTNTGPICDTILLQCTDNMVLCNA